MWFFVIINYLLLKLSACLNWSAEGVVKFYRRRRGGSLRDAVSGVQGRRAVLVRVGQGSEEDQGDAARVRPVLLRRLNGGASQRVGI